MNLDNFINHIFTICKSRQMLYFGKNSLLHYSIFFHDLDCMSIGDNVYISRYSSVTAWKKRQNQIFSPKVVIGNNVYIGPFAHITCINRIEIGNGCEIGENVTISDNNHGYINYKDINIDVSKRDLSSNGPVLIGDFTWIGDKVSILPNVTLGRNCIVGANSVVTKSFTDNSVIAGNPAKLIKKL